MATSGVLLTVRRRQVHRMRWAEPVTRTAGRLPRRRMRQRASRSLHTDQPTAARTNENRAGVLQQRIGSNNNFREAAMKIRYSSAAIVCTLMLSSIASAAGKNIYVTNDGTDSASCGTQANACRSISQGLENAVDGDTILVGAGRYGNISGSASYSGAGDEHPQLFSRASFDDVTGCIICIQKAVSIYSLHGPSVTVIEGA